jgi:hypothetical protein
MVVLKYLLMTDFHKIIFSRFRNAVVFARQNPRKRSRWPGLWQFRIFPDPVEGYRVCDAVLLYRIRAAPPKFLSAQCHQSAISLRQSIIYMNIIIILLNS